MAGEAVTVRYVPAREDLATFESLGDPDHPQRRTIEEFPAGKVLVLDCRRVGAAAGVGDILVARLKVRGAAGAVMDGGVRDYAGVAAMGPARLRPGAGGAGERPSPPRRGGQCAHRLRRGAGDARRHHGG